MGEDPVNIYNRNNANYSVPAIPISTTRLLCISPPSTPGNYTIHIYRNGVDTSLTKVVYEYLPFFAFLSGIIFINLFFIIIFFCDHGFFYQFIFY
jgi:hypothetical protein